MNRRIKYKNQFLTIATILFISVTEAQKTDSLTPLRDFVAISTGYKQMPMYLDLVMKNSTNFITSTDDTITARGEFYLREENSYVRFGEFEQIVNDSMALLVSDNLQQMILYRNAGAVVNRMKAMMGAPMADSSIRTLSLRYRSMTNSISKESSTIELQSRTNLFGTSLPKETITLKYDIRNRFPQQVTTMKRSLVRIDSLLYVRLQNEGQIADPVKNLFTLEGSYFLVKEQVTAYVYNKIVQASAATVPVLISDRIQKTEEGEYMPVKNYASYRLTKND